MGVEKLTIIAFLIVATALETSGDAIVRVGLAHPPTWTRALLFVGGAVLLFGYGVMLNLAPLPFERVAGIYIATLFIMFQVISYAAFRTLPTTPILVGGALVVAGGVIVAFWE
jgi:small multidrug resistance family-3 protein